MGDSGAWRLRPIECAAEIMFSARRNSGEEEAAQEAIRLLLLADDDGLKAARATAIPGTCMFCEEPIPEPRGKRIICGSHGCRRAYDRAHRRDRLAGGAE